MIRLLLLSINLINIEWNAKCQVWKHSEFITWGFSFFSFFIDIFGRLINVE